jgi:transcriptional antiterminator RfaH
MHWYVIHTKPRQEQRALENLQRQGFEAWLPMITLEKVRRGHLAQVVEPMFSRHLFIRLDTVQTNWSPIRSTLGVSKLVAFGNTPAAVPDDLISALRNMPAPPRERMMNPGDEVQFVAGPLKGLRGIYQQHDGEARAMVLIELLSQPQTIQTELQALRPLAA